MSAPNKKSGPAESRRPIPNFVLADRSEDTALLLQLRSLRLTRLCCVVAAIAETLGPMIFGVLL
jgi:hypothetical protein